MVLNARLDGDVAILSSLGRLMNDPRHFDAGGEVRDLLDGGVRRFILEMADVRDLGNTALGLLVTLTRQVRQAGGQIVLARVGRGVVEAIEAMRMDDYWDIAASVEEAKALFPRVPGRSD